MMEVNIKGAQATINGIRHVAKVTPGRSVSAMNDAVKHARTATIRQLAKETGLPRRLLAGAGARGRGGHIKRSVARVRRPWAKLIGLVAGVRLARLGRRAPGAYALKMPPSVTPRLFWQTMRSGHRGIFARYPVPSRYVSARASPGTERRNLPINEAVVELYPAARRIMLRAMDHAWRNIYPKALWQKLEKAIRRQAARAR